MIVGFELGDIEEFLQILLGILYLGNILIATQDSSEGEVAIIENIDVLYNASSILSVDAAILQSIITERRGIYIYCYYLLLLSIITIIIVIIISMLLLLLLLLFLFYYYATARIQSAQEKSTL